MREFGDNFLFSASDLMRFMGCGAYATTLDLMHMRGEGPEPDEHSDGAALLQKQVHADAAAHLARLPGAHTGAELTASHSRFTFSLRYSGLDTTANTRKNGLGPPRRQHRALMLKHRTQPPPRLAPKSSN